MGHSATILTVSYNSWGYLYLNYILSQKMGCQECQWIIVNNRPSMNDEKKLYYKKLSEKNNVKIVSGINKEDLLMQLNNRGHSASFHHGWGLNIGIKYCNTNFIIILDPDFFIIRKNWIQRVLIHMEEVNKSFFGATWTPRYADYLKTKWNDFPCTHFNCIDLRNVELTMLDFLPVDKDNQWEGKDTGFRIRNYAQSNHHSSEIQLLDCCKKIDFFGYPPIYFPKHPPLLKIGGTTHGLAGFREIFDLMDFFTWDGQRFAIHMRNAPKGYTNPEVLSERQFDYLLQCMAYLTLNIFP